MDFDHKNYLKSFEKVQQNWGMSSCAANVGLLEEELK